MKEDFKNLEQLKDFYLKEKPEVEAYTFRGKGVEWGFTIIFSAGRIYIGGDAGDNVFTIRGTNQELKDWLIGVDLGYALSKSHQGKEYFDKDFAEEYLREELQEDEIEPLEIDEIIESLDFSCHELLLNSMSEHRDNFPEISEYRLLGWSPMQKMQYKQLLFAGKFLHDAKQKEVR